MKHMRKLASLLLVLVMLFAMTAAVLADEGTASNSITVNKVQSGETYKLFKMFDLVVSEDLTAYSYTINENWETFFTTGAGKDYITLDNGYVKWNESKADAASMEAFGKAAAAYAETTASVPVIKSITAGETDTSITFTGLEPGYYLITSSNGSLAIVDTTPTNPAATVNEKNENPTLDKEVKEDGTGNWGKENTAQIGDTVEFKTTITLKKGAKNYVMHDKMDAGLTFDGQVEIEGLEEGTEFTVEDNPDDSCTFEVVFDQTYLDSLNGDTILTVTYTAALNENAVEDGNRKDQKNDAKLTWGDKSGTEWSETTTKTFQFDLIKYDAKDNTKTPIAGAVFQLQDKDGNVIRLRKVNDHTYKIAAGDDVDTFALTEGEELLESFTTIAGTKITIIGLDLEDTYYLEELTAPEGYNKLKDKVEVKVNAENTYVVEVPNSTGTELPSTGGMGTTLFYVFGSALLIGAAVLLITKKRMGADA